jgi:hypothetical protein
MGSNSRKKRRDAWRAKQISWREVWELPLKLDTCDSYAYSANKTMALTFESDTEYQCRNARRIVQIINGEVEPREGERWINNGVDFYTQDKNYGEEPPCAWCYVFCVRGWGHLTGSPMRLPEKGAARIQDDFIAYILEKLNSKK